MTKIEITDEMVERGYRAAIRKRTEPLDTRAQIRAALEAALGPPQTPFSSVRVKTSPGIPPSVRLVESNGLYDYYDVGRCELLSQHTETPCASRVMSQGCVGNVMWMRTDAGNNRWIHARFADPFMRYHRRKDDAV